MILSHVLVVQDHIRYENENTQEIRLSWKNITILADFRENSKLYLSI